jgi:hypothetical protein
MLILAEAQGAQRITITITITTPVPLRSLRLCERTYLDHVPVWLNPVIRLNSDYYNEFE